MVQSPTATSHSTSPVRAFRATRWGVVGGDEQLVVVEGAVAVDAGQGRRMVDLLPAILPEARAVAHVEGLDEVARLHQEHHPVVHERRRLLPPLPHGPRPREPQAADVRRVDLIERTVPPVAVGPPPHRPVLRRRVQQHVPGHRRVAVGDGLRRGGRPGEQEADQDRAEPQPRHDAHVVSSRSGLACPLPLSGGPTRRKSAGASRDGAAPDADCPCPLRSGSQCPAAAWSRMNSITVWPRPVPDVPPMMAMVCAIMAPANRQVRRASRAESVESRHSGVRWPPCSTLVRTLPSTPTSPACTLIHGAGRGCDGNAQRARQVHGRGGGHGGHGPEPEPRRGIIVDWPGVRR